MKELETIDAETLLYNPLKETEFIIYFGERIK